MKILFVEDNPDFRNEIVFQLGRIGHAVIALDCGQALLDWLEANQAPDVLLLDLGLPDHDGLELAQQLRPRYPNLPIVMLTARGEMDDRVRGWDAGADAYLTKPIHLKELQAVLASQRLRLSRVQVQPVPSNRRENAWILDAIGNRLTSPCGEGRDLSLNEVQLLQALAQEAGSPVDRMNLVGALGEQRPWDYDMRRLEAIMSRLRKKIIDMGGDKALLRPVRCKGYLFAAPLVVRNRNRD